MSVTNTPNSINRSSNWRSYRL